MRLLRNDSHEYTTLIMTSKYLLIGLLLCGMVSLTMCGCATTPASKKKTVQGPARKILKTREKNLLSSLSSSPKAYAHYSMGMIYDNEGNAAQAIEEYLKAVEFDSGSGVIYYKLDRKSVV